MFELLIILGLVALAGGTVALTTPPQTMPGKPEEKKGGDVLMQLLDFPAFTLKPGELATVSVLSRAGLDPSQVLPAVANWNLVPRPQGSPQINAMGAALVKQGIQLPTIQKTVDLWQVDVMFNGPADTAFTPQSVLEGLADRYPDVAKQLTSGISAPQKLATILAAVSTYDANVPQAFITIPVAKAGA